MSKNETNSNPRVFAVVPAAGRSRRMGTDKALLNIGGRPMLIGVAGSLMDSRVAGVLMVTRRGILERLPPLDPRVVVAFNEDESTEMIDSVRIGLREWCVREVVGLCDGFLVCPGDHPGIATADVNACIDCFAARPDRIVVATRGGRRGHPIIFSAGDCALVESSACDGGLNHLPATYPKRIQLVDCTSPGITKDIDFPGDLD